MSVTRTKHCTIHYRWCFPVIPWYRQLISLIYGLGVILIALWALEQGQSQVVILGVVAMSMLTLLLIFGVEIEAITLGDRLQIEFTDTTNNDDEDSDDS